MSFLYFKTKPHAATLICTNCREHVARVLHETRLADEAARLKTHNMDSSVPTRGTESVALYSTTPVLH